MREARYSFWSVEGGGGETEQSTHAKTPAGVQVGASGGRATPAGQQATVHRKATAFFNTSVVVLVFKSRFHGSCWLNEVAFSSRLATDVARSRGERSSGLLNDTASFKSRANVTSWSAATMRTGDAIAVAPSRKEVKSLALGATRSMG